MKRLLLGIAAFAFLSLVGVQAAHSHANPAAEGGCNVCIVSQQSSLLAPAAAPAIVVTVRWLALPQTAGPLAADAVAGPRRARSPPERP